MLKYTKKIGLITLIVLIDIITKILLDGKSITVIEGVLSFQSTYNTGAAWSILEGQMLFFIISALIFIIAVSLFDFFTKNKGKIYFFGFSLMIAGTIGNLIDRISYGYVRDFIKLDFVNYPIFNIADMALVVGAVMFSVYILFIADDKQKKA